MKKHFTFIAVLCLFVFTSTLAQAKNYELRKLNPSAPGGFNSVGTYPSYADCAKAMKAAKISDPAGSYACMEAH
ncbi:hypothetical protein BGC07_10570 [Piscirickettsia litoralis]|uniref:Uncharacterized protein n=1 Tax=Piscirickettsia litoralis TaxID=1891921 RepID=A0ABX3A6G3_9GAMM|nr:hypothetical protein BGC07_10570 [Piscirickettsia litoralis]